MPTSQPSDPASAPAIVPVQPDTLESLEADWAALWRRSPAATPFQSPAWLLPWSRHFAPGRTAAVSLRVGGRLAGLLPVFTWEDALLLAGTGPSDYGDLLIEPGLEAAVPALLAALPTLRCGPWTQVDLRQLPQGSPLLRASAPADWADETLPGEPCHLATVSGPDGIGAASQRWQSNWRYAMRRLQREGASIGLASPEDTPQGTADLIRLHQVRWKSRGEAGIFADPLLAAFLRDAGPALAREGILRLHEVRFGAARAALLMVLAAPQMHLYYISGFDPAWKRLGPSAALVGAAMRQARSENAATFDFLRGPEPYKRHWGAEPRATYRRVLVPATRP